MFRSNRKKVKNTTFFRNIYVITIIPLISLGIVLTITLFCLFRNSLIIQIVHNEQERIEGIKQALRRSHLAVQEIGLRYLDILRSTKELSPQDQENLMITVLTEQDRDSIESIYLYQPSSGFTIVRPKFGMQRMVNPISNEKMALLDPEAIIMTQTYDTYYGRVPLARTITSINSPVEVYTYVLPLFSLARVSYNSILVVNMSKLWLDSLLDITEGEAFIIDKDKRILSTNTEQGFLFPVNESINLTIVNGENISDYYIGNYQGKSAVFIYSQIEWSKWVVIDIIQIESISPELQRLLYISLAVCISLLVVFLVINLVTSKQVFKPIKTLYTRLEDLEKDEQQYRYKLKQEFFHSLMAEKFSDDSQNMTEMFASLEIGLDYLSSFRVIGIGIEKGVIDDIRGQITEVIGKTKSEIFEVSKDELVIVTQFSDDLFTRYTEAIARVIIDIGWVALSNEYGNLSKLSHAVTDIKHNLSRIRFWQLSRGLVSPCDSEEITTTDKLYSLEQCFIQAIKDHNSQAGMKYYKEIMTEGIRSNYIHFRIFLIHFGFEISSAVRKYYSGPIVERRRKYSIVDDSFIQRIDNARSFREIGLHATISDRKLRRPPGRKLLAYRIDREPLPPCKVRVKGQPLRGGLTRQAGWHGGHSQSIPAAISCKHQHTTGGRPCLIYAGSMTRISRKML